LDSLDRNKVLQQLGRKYDVNVDRTAEGIKVRGLVSEAVAAKMAINEAISGRARFSVEVNAEQMAQLVNHGDVNWRRVREDFAVSVDLDKTHQSIIIQGSNFTVPKAKEYTYRLLDLLFPSHFGRIPLPAEALPAFSSSGMLAKIKEQSGVEAVWPDRDVTCLRVRGDATTIAAATTTTTTLLAEWVSKHATVGFEAWMLPYLIGKQGAKLKEMEKVHGVVIDVDREGEVAKISGSDSSSVQAAKAAWEEVVGVIKKECAEVEVPPEAIPSLIGKKGSNLSAIRQETGV